MFLSKRKNKYWYLFYKNTNGKITMVSCRTKSKSEALKFVSEFKSAIKNDNEPELQNYKLSDLYNEITKYAKTNYSAKTVKEYKSVFNNFAVFTGDINLKLMSVQLIENYKAHKLSQVTPDTVNKHLRTLKAGFNFAIKLNWITENPFNKIVKIKIPQKNLPIFNSEEICALFSVISDKNILLISKFALLTGCRLNEILNLQWNDVNFSNETITIKNKATFKTKSGKIRIIPMTENIKELLLSIKTNYRNSNIIEFISTSDNYIFKKDNDIKFTPDFVTHKFKNYCRKAGLPEHLHFHGLRHTYITDLVKKGLNINFIKELAGHSDIKTTLIYTHLTIEDLKQAIKNI